MTKIEKKALALVNEVLNERGNYQLYAAISRASDPRHEVICSLIEQHEALQAAVMAVVDAVRDYLPPDGISEKDFISRVIGAVDNPTINPVIFAIEAALQERGDA